MSRHKNPTYEKRTAFAPYNFVPLPEKVLTVPEPNGHDKWEGESGYFDCTIETSSPLYIRGLKVPPKVQSPDTEADPTFYSFDNGKTPRIPGSSLRGMFRSLIEIITYSKPYAISDQKLVYRSVDTTNHGARYHARLFREEDNKEFEPLFKCGYMRIVNGDWFIQPAIEIDGTTFARINHAKIPESLSSWHDCSNVHQIFIKPSEFTFQDVRGGSIKIKYSKVLEASSHTGKGLIEGVLSPSGKMDKKESEAVIFAPDLTKKESSEWIFVEKDMIDLYHDQISKEQESLLGKNGVLQDWYPVFYLLEENELVFFGHSQLFRLPYKKSPRDLIDPSLLQVDGLDMTEALFGYVNEEENGRDQARSGRVFFSDAICLPDQESIFERVITPQVLGTPKPTTFQHYLEQPHPDDKDNLEDFDSPEARLRGNKLYWHKGNVSIDDIKETDPEKLKKKNVLTKIKPIRKGIRFRFRLRFENLSLEELGSLIWILEIAANPNYRLNLGMAKPLGMGAIKIESDLSLIDKKAFYANLFMENESKWFSGKTKEESTTKTYSGAKRAFENWVLTDSTINPKSEKSTLSELARIKTLLLMLSWPGPDKSQTRYLEIDRNDPTLEKKDRKEYKERMVLPDPSGVGATGLKRGAPPSTKKEEIKTEPKKSTKIIRSVSDLNPELNDPLPVKRERVKPAANDFMAFLNAKTSENDTKKKEKKSKKKK